MRAFTSPPPNFFVNVGSTCKELNINSLNPKKQCGGLCCGLHKGAGIIIQAIVKTHMKISPFVQYLTSQLKICFESRTYS